MENEKTPAATGAKQGWRLIVDEPMADAVARLNRNAHVAEPFRSTLNLITPLVKGSLRFELMPDDDGLEANNG